MDSAKSLTSADAALVGPVRVARNAFPIRDAFTGAVLTNRGSATVNQDGVESFVIYVSYKLDRGILLRFFTGLCPLKGSRAHQTTVSLPIRAITVEL